MQYAVVFTGGNQYRVEKGKVIRVEKLPGEIGSEVEFPVLMLRDEEGVKVGNPYLEGVKVVGRIVNQGRGKKGGKTMDGLARSKYRSLPAGGG